MLTESGLFLRVNLTWAMEIKAFMGSICWALGILTAQFFRVSKQRAIHSLTFSVFAV